MKTLEELKKKQQEEMDKFLRDKEIMDSLSVAPHGIHDTFISFEFNKMDKEEAGKALNTVIKELKPKDEPKKITSATKRYEHHSKFVLSVQKGYYDEYCNIRYHCVNGLDIWIRMPISFYKDYLGIEHRSLSDSEYHYYTGVSLKRLREMKVRAYVWSRFKNLRFVGGERKAQCVHPEEVKLYDELVLNGKIDE